MSGTFSFGGVIGWALLVVLLSLYGIIGAYAPYVLLALSLVATPYIIAVRAGRPMVPDLTTWGFLAAFVLMAIAYSFAHEKWSDVLIVANFAWLLLFVPMKSLLGRLARANAAAWIARLALLGVILLCGLAAYEHFGLGEQRAGYLNSDPIRIANTSVILGFLALMGLIAEAGRWRIIYLLGPVLALLVAYFAGTRGAMVSTAVIAVVAAILLVRRKDIAVAVAIALGITAIAALLIAAQLHVPRVDSLVRTIEQIFSGSSVTDGSATIRLAMQRTAVEAFLQSPWFGHGWQRIMSTATALLPPDQKDLFKGQPHLHNDLANFAVAAGVLGLLAHATILLSPVVAVLRGGRDALYRARLYGVGILAASYFFLGLNALMFGYEVHTALFCGLAAVLVGFCRETSKVELDALHAIRPMGEPGLLERSIVWLLLALALVLSTTIGLVTPYILVVIGIGIFFVLMIAGRLPQSYQPPAAKLLLIAFAAIAVDFALSAKAGGDVLYAFNFTFLFLFGPIALLMQRAPGRISIATMSRLAALGTILALAMVLYFELRGVARPQGVNLGPIVLSNAVLALAVVATVGSIALRDRMSLALVLTIPLAAVVTVLTDSRGPLLALLPLLVFTAIMLWRARFRRSVWFWVTTGALTVLTGAGFYLVAHGRITHLPKILGGFFGGESIDDKTTNIRLALYKAGWQSFLESPWIGHGWARLMSSILPYIDPAYVAYAKKLPQLHNDVFNFAVSGGIVGVGIYLLIIAAPLIAAFRSPRDSLRAARIYGTVGLAIVYVCGGVTDLMFGHEFHTMLFVMLNAIVLGLVREPAPAPAVLPVNRA